MGRTFKSERDLCTVEDVISRELAVSRYCGNLLEIPERSGQLSLFTPRPCGDITRDEKRSLRRCKFCCFSNSENQEERQVIP